MCARVAEIMTDDVVAVEQTTTLESVARQMLGRDIGSVVITAESTPYGIITESDIVSAAYQSGRPLADIPTKRVASHPLVTIEPNRSTRLAVKRMQDERIKKLVVVDGLEIQGIITTQDLIDHYGYLSEKLQTVREQRQREPSWPRR
ncbi:CBS domain-containing protein [Natrialba sp. SSL1]|uniref:CBS domain-containing protein n=1 Tax=Natrialba sp. SSL1 TaxID=1869245 RepID=UPI0008F975B8|nr:CBS domain-containing protein [Natrialba sp. SSL1]OIB56080.1 histidine kinase [Natrialba sp. SSL1]